MITAWVLAGVSLIIWIVLILGRGGFWLPQPQLRPDPPVPGTQQQAPSVVAIIPARNEASVIAETLPTVLDQDYRGEFRVILVDDRSDDETVLIARQAAEQSRHPHLLTVHTGQPLPAGWAGKVWAMHQGAEQALQQPPDYLWFTDSDIAHVPGTLRSLVEKATTGHRDLVSLMALLRIDTFWDHLLIPAFVYFFAKLYPFRFVNNPRRRTAGAAGGCILVRQEVLSAAGGVDAIRSALIDDCALGKLIKGYGGSIWLGFARGTRSVRSYGTLRSVWDMVSRSAYHQLNYSVMKLIGTVVGMLLIYATPPLAVIAGAASIAVGVHGGGVLAMLGGAAWGLMSLSFLPMLRHQRASLWLAPLLPAAGALYTAMTVSSAWRHVTGRGGMWKGRPYTGSA